ncbi:unnamed protein product [Effrenium voratum]|uniref:Non-canonical E2 ubiquitin-conjugating enzyme C-terminal domain-containing protein n=1 Tax=Effrenium voratum TaxID=2562239 RepID=A0AA36N0X4_9DINO|nr:unnamed protein product [Effrenium voratum]
MQVSHNYEQGQQLLQSREFSTRGPFFQTVLEIGRRYKILNPERMRDSYGKLMYFLQDSRKPEVRDLLEFDIVSPVRSVWDVLKRSPKGVELLEDPQLKIATMEIMSEAAFRSSARSRRRSPPSRASPPSTAPWHGGGSGTTAASIPPGTCSAPTGSRTPKTSTMGTSCQRTWWSSVSIPWATTAPT